VRNEALCVCVLPLNISGTKISSTLKFVRHVARGTWWEKVNEGDHLKL